MKFLVLLSLFCVSVYAHPHHEESRRQLGATQPAGGVTESPSAVLMRLKLLTYQQKLQDKETKKQAKAEKKAQKDAAWNTYMTSLASSLTPAASAGVAPAAPAASPPAALPVPAVVPPVPLIPALGLWRKTFLISQLMSAAAAQNAAIAAAAAQTAATTTTTTTTQTPNVPAVPEAAAAQDDVDDDDEDAQINEIVKRYAPVLRRKFYGIPDKHQYYEDVDEEPEDEAESENQEGQDAADIPVEDEDDDDDQNPAAYQSGSFNKFGTGPAGSPNGVGYEDAKVNQAGCSGSHIHICSGTTVYLTNPDDVTNQNPILQIPSLKPEEVKNESGEEAKSKHGQKRRFHGHHQ